MFITTLKKVNLTGQTELVVGYEYDGPLDLTCGATGQQKDIAKTSTDFFKNAIDQAKSIFGSASSVFQDLVKTFSPTVAAGPNQEGFSAAEKGTLQSQAITNAGTDYRNASTAVKEANAAVGGGNIALPGGSEIGRNIQVANAGAAETSKELSTINTEDYEVGRQNYNNAVKGLEEAPGVFGTANQAVGAATGSGGQASSAANDVAQADNSWVNSVTSALGGIAGDVVTGGMKNLGGGKGFFG